MSVKLEEKSGCSAFLELVGIRYSVIGDDHPIGSYVNKFRDGLAISIDKLMPKSKQIHVYFLRSSAFVRVEGSAAASMELLVSFLDSLRFELFRKDVFFRGAIAKSAIPVSQVWSVASGSQELRETRMSVLQGWNFDGCADELVKSQDMLKGIGLTVASDSKAVVVCSAFMNMKSKGFATFDDLPFGRQVRTKRSFDRIIKVMLQARTKRHSEDGSSERLSKFFVTPLITWAQSIEFDKSLTPKTFDSEEELAKFDPLLNSLYFGQLRKHLGRNGGFPQIAFALWSNLIRSERKMQRKTYLHLEEFFAGLPGLMEAIGTLPKDLLPTLHRKTITTKILERLSGISPPEDELEKHSVEKSITDE